MKDLLHLEMRIKEPESWVTQNFSKTSFGKNGLNKFLNEIIIRSSRMTGEFFLKENLVLCNFGLCYIRFTCLIMSDCICYLLDMGCQMNCDYESK